MGITFKRPFDETWFHNLVGVKIGKSDEGIRIYLLRSTEYGDIAVLIDKDLDVRFQFEHKRIEERFKIGGHI